MQGAYVYHGMLQDILCTLFVEQSPRVLNIKQFQPGPSEHTNTLPQLCRSAANQNQVPWLAWWEELAEQPTAK